MAHTIHTTSNNSQPASEWFLATFWTKSRRATSHHRTLSCRQKFPYSSLACSSSLLSPHTFLRVWEGGGFGGGGSGGDDDDDDDGRPVFPFFVSLFVYYLSSFPLLVFSPFFFFFLLPFPLLSSLVFLCVVYYLFCLTSRLILWGTCLLISAHSSIPTYLFFLISPKIPNHPSPHLTPFPIPCCARHPVCATYGLGAESILSTPLFLFFSFFPSSFSRVDLSSSVRHSRCHIGVGPEKKKETFYRDNME